MKSRRVVTGLDLKQRSIVASDDQAPRVLARDDWPGLMVAEIWATHESPPRLPSGPQDPTLEGWTYWPAPGETRFRLVRFPPPDEIEAALAAGHEVTPAAREALAKARDESARTPWENPGMHATNSVDYAVIVSGELWMELDSGAEVLLKQGDCVVQNGTNHAWVNKGPEECLVAFVLIGIQDQAAHEETGEDR